MADNDHKSIPTAQRHNPKGFEAASNSSTLTKDASGLLVWEVGTPGGLVRKSINIGDWDMDANPTTSVAHGLSATEWKTIKDIDAVIRNDADTGYYDINRLGDVTNGLTDGSVDSWDSTNLYLNRYTGGFFDTTTFNSTSYNRGYITYSYIPD